MAHYNFFQNKECEFFPCHPNAERESFSCLFCYCPLYALGDRCGGNYQYTPDGIKDCTYCLRPHRKENYDSICKQLSQVLELAKKNRSEDTEINFQKALGVI